MEKKDINIGDSKITINDNDVTVSKIYPSAIAALREIARLREFKVDPNWNTQELGRRLLEEFCDGENNGIIEEFQIQRALDKRITVEHKFNNTIAALRQCAARVGFKFENNWDTQEIANKLVDYINGNYKKEGFFKRLLKKIRG